MTRFVVVPQWQGSSSVRAMQLVDGARAIAGDLPQAACTIVDEFPHAGEALDTGVHRLSALQHIARTHVEALRGHDEPTLTVGGDGSVATTAALAALDATEAAGDEGALVVWFSAHPDLHGPDSSPTGGYDTMAARALFDADVPRPAGRDIRADRLLLAGIRAIDPVEAEIITRYDIAALNADALTPASLAEAVAARAPSSVFIHVDLDVLDPAAITGVSTPVPFGPDVAELTACIRAVRETAPLRSAAITEFSPASPADAVADLGAILRIVGALA